MAEMEEKNKHDGVTATVVMVGAVVALVAWGISKWLGKSEPEPSNQDKMMKAPGRGVGVMLLDEMLLM
ncbi:hypothetical protein BUALT_Bualt05G0140100 [Buddleja alternifolia]|uniref:Uncharacterized protein n=1 Tax=Buddleja alternifolia TaxID=168488 RepID=A0AAV6XSA2_9LAMI|nr:hypothetical protein BUALT_Bualt05G0140100 [Buddleja alternifolia]